MIIKDPNYAHEYYGMSTDTKPLSVPNASLFYEIDTSDIYMFDEDGQQWFKQSSGASGGSSGGSSSSASSGILMVNLTVNADTRAIAMDKTWQEIHDADYAIVNYEASTGSEFVTSRYVIANTQIADGTYVVTMLGVTPGSDTAQTMICTTDSPDGYPSFYVSSH